MADFLEAMLHPDGEIALFNDSALGIAPAPQELLSRAGRPSAASGKVEEEVKILRETGYAVIREPLSNSRLIFDCGPVGADDQPGHAHCDVLSYELSLRGRRVVVDTGVSGYEPGPERHYERSTAAHNTLRIDGEEQAEIWASFRVGRRPKTGSIESGQVAGFRFVRGIHHGYQRLGVVHARQIILSPGNCWIVVDCLQGEGRRRIESFVHFHPRVQVKACRGVDNPSPGELQKRFVINSADDRYFLLFSNLGAVALKDAWYSPEFGRREKQAVCCWTWEGALPARLVYCIAPAGRSLPAVSLEGCQESIEIDRVRIPLTGR